jgi:hypothetical protein
MLERMLAGLFDSRYARTGEPVGSEIDAVSRATSKVGGVASSCRVRAST